MGDSIEFKDVLVGLSDKALLPLNFEACTAIFIALFIRENKF